MAHPAHPKPHGLVPAADALAQIVRTLTVAETTAHTAWLAAEGDTGDREYADRRYGAWRATADALDIARQGALAAGLPVAG